MFRCKNCNKIFVEKYSKLSNGNFCCKKCARSYSTKEKRKIINKQLKEKMFAKNILSNGQIIDFYQMYMSNPKLCSICHNIIPYERRKYKTCCSICEKKSRMKNHNHNGGGYRKNSGRSKHGYYKGIYCDSTYELAYLIYCLDHNIPIKRCEESFEYEYEGKKHLYHPDFVLNETQYVEIKGYHSLLVDIKLKAVNKPIKIMYYDDLIEIFNYVSITYNKKYNRSKNNFYELYDGFKSG